MNFTNKGLGDRGEEIAVELLTEKGYEIIERKYRYSNKGEIDIIAKDSVTSYNVFVEVKTRYNLEFGEPEFAITKNKIRQLRKMAEAYLYDKNITEAECRFDVITVLLSDKSKPVINHIVNAF